MQPEEFAELHGYVRRTMRDRGLSEIDDSITPALRQGADRSPGRLLLDYLEAFDTELALRSSQTVERAMNVLNELIDPDTARQARIERMVVELDDTDSTGAGIDEIDLNALPDLDPIRGELRALISELRDELDRP